MENKEISEQLPQRKALSVPLGCTCPANESTQWFAHQFPVTEHFLKGSFKPRWLSNSWAKALYLSFCSNCLKTRKMLTYLRTGKQIQLKNRKHSFLWEIAHATLKVLKLLSWNWNYTNHMMTWRPVAPCLGAHGLCRTLAVISGVRRSLYNLLYP